MYKLIYGGSNHTDISIKGNTHSRAEENNEIIWEKESTPPVPSDTFHFENVETGLKFQFPITRFRPSDFYVAWESIGGFGSVVVLYDKDFSEKYYPKYNDSLIHAVLRSEQYGYYVESQETVAANINYLITKDFINYNYGHDNSVIKDLNVESKCAGETRFYAFASDGAGEDGFGELLAFIYSKPYDWGSELLTHVQMRIYRERNIGYNIIKAVAIGDNAILVEHGYDSDHSTYKSIPVEHNFYLYNASNSSFTHLAYPELPTFIEEDNTSYFATDDYFYIYTYDVADAASPGVLTNMYNEVVYRFSKDGSVRKFNVTSQSKTYFGGRDKTYHSFYVYKDKYIIFASKSNSVQEQNDCIKVYNIGTGKMMSADTGLQVNWESSQFAPHCVEDNDGVKIILQGSGGILRYTKIYLP